MTKIYGLAHPKTGRIRYVGKTIISLKARLSNHEYKARSGRTCTPIGIWIRRLQQAGLRPKIVLLQVVRGRWQNAERRWISKLKTSGARLLNAHPGGNGAHTRACLPKKFQCLLGKISDARIAEMAGLCRETITYHRLRAGVPASGDRSRLRGFAEGHQPHNTVVLPKRFMSLLGKMSDRELAMKAGVGRKTVTRIRDANGVPQFPHPKNRRR